jgi:hypothetical protein
MTINSIYLFLENHGNILRDYYLNNTLTYSNTITDEWVYDSNLNRISFNFKPNSINYFHKSLTENYNESFSIFFHLKIDNLSLYQDENTDYFIFDSINPDGSNQLKSFAIVLQKISNKYFYKLKINNLNNGNQYLDIYEINNSINNLNQYICIVWDENNMRIKCYFKSDNTSLSEKVYGYDSSIENYNGPLPSTDGLDIYYIYIYDLVVGYGYHSINNNQSAQSFIGQIGYIRIDENIYSIQNILNLINYRRLSDINNFFSGRNYFPNYGLSIYGNYGLIDNINPDNIHFIQTSNIKDSLYGWSSTSPINSNGNILNNYSSYLFSNTLNDYFSHKLLNSYNGSFNFYFWIKLTSDSNNPFFSLKIPKNGSNIYLDVYPEINENNSRYILSVNYNNNISYLNIGNISKDINNQYSWDNITFSYIQQSQSIESYLNVYNRKIILVNTNIILESGTDINVGIDSSQQNTYDGYFSGLVISNTALTKEEVSILFSTSEICYHPDTLISTNKGDIKIKNLKRGDLIKTLNGYKKLARLLTIDCNKIEDTYIIFNENSLGNNIPNNKLIITKGHPIYYKGEYYNPEDFAESTDFNVNYIDKIIINMYHIQFETHEVIYSNNLTTTSLPPYTNYLNLHLPEDLYFDKEKFSHENIGKHYPPYFLHDDPLLPKKPILG